jgi:FKBP-type peptidyl-prolyl cis-trans isomerase FkpA
MIGPSLNLGDPMKASSVLTLFLVILFLSQDLLADDSPGMKYWNGIRAKAHVTESGLQYKIRNLGDGPRPSSKSRVRVHYNGMLMNGVEFDSSYNEDEPIQLSLSRVIKGWQEGIQLMPAGSTFTFLIPPELAYGERGTDGIPPNSTLIFDVDLYDF